MKSLACPRPAAVVVVVFALFIQACGSAPAPGSASNAPPTIGTASGGSGSATSTIPTASAPAVGKLGAALVANGASILVTQVRQADKLPDGQQARAGDTYLIADVQLANIDATDVSYSQYTFKVEDADGKSYDTVVTLDSAALKQGELSKGQNAHGALAFEVTKAAKGFVLIYTRTGVGDMQIKLAS